MDAIIKELPGVIAVVISVLGVYLQYRKARLDEAKGRVEAKKADAEAGQVLQETALALIKPYRDELDRLNMRIKNLEGDVVILRNKLDLVIQERNAIWNGAKVLHFQVKNIGAEPVYTPPESVVELTGTFRVNGDVGQDEVDKLLGK